jgi:hypothetical protein
MIARSGIRASMFSRKGTMAKTPLNIFYVGIKKGGGFVEITDAEVIEDYLGRPLRNKLSIKTEQTSLQARIKELDVILGYVKNRGADMQIVSVLDRGQTTNAVEGIYNFFGEDAPGIDFEFVRSPKENYLKVITELNYDYATGQALIQAAATNAINSDLALTSQKTGQDITKYVKPGLSVIGDPDNTPIYESKEEVDDYKLTVKPKGNKTVYGRLIADYIDVEFMVVLRGPNVEKINEILSRDMNAALLFSSPIIAPNANNVLSPGYEAYYLYNSMFTTKTRLEDDKRLLTITYKSSIPLTDTVVEFGDGERQQVVKFFEN